MSVLVTVESGALISIKAKGESVLKQKFTLKWIKGGTIKKSSGVIGSNIKWSTQTYAPERDASINVFVEHWDDGQAGYFESAYRIEQNGNEIVVNTEDSVEPDGGGDHNDCVLTFTW